MPTAIWKSRLRSGSAHCNLEVAVEVRQCPLRSGARGGGPAVPTGIWSSRWRSGCASKLKPKTKPAKKAMPKQKLKVVDEGHGPRSQEFDTSKFTSAQDLVWIEPDNMAGVPMRRVDYGRLSSISHAMSDYLRGHRMFHRRPSPEIRRNRPVHGLPCSCSTPTRRLCTSEGRRGAHGGAKLAHAEAPNPSEQPSLRGS